MTIQKHRTNEVADSLRELGHASGDMDEALGTPITGTPEWDAFTASWEDLAMDTFMADGGTYRLRRYSEFDCTATGIELLPHQAYSQAKEINYLNGGAPRLFEPFSDGVAHGPVADTLLSWCARQLDETEGRGPRTWFAQVFQNRILARPGTAGKPTPEGVHRDGVDYVFTMVIDRKGITGGTSSLYEALPNGRHGKRIVSVEIPPPGGFLLNDDERTLHGVTPVVPLPGETEGYRDTFIAVLSRRP
ncbi:2OG-Fe dioxygenase family protein [Streptomyces olivoreticuli]|uniref:2OG-Fe dioxygenase family protein n=1 Tax=Streptomyces olivoreticuli TaxID=68246 RepID=UPI0013C2FAA5|nr:2OG-Fe dioxygenase family protein [Streptomyces olivoreticuli]